MGILGIENRTENWKTASHFIPLMNINRAGALADRLTPNLPPRSEEPKLELFWKGMRDFIHQSAIDTDTLRQNATHLYNNYFTNLRGAVESIKELADLQSHNYDASTHEHQIKLFQNLRNTEVDIVLEDSESLFIGEAKHEMSFGADGKLILVHQLMRQYVMARILLDMSLSTASKSIVPFVVGDDASKLKKISQVRFMINHGWLQEDNVLSWQEIKEMAS